MQYRSSSRHTFRTACFCKRRRGVRHGGSVTRDTISVAGLHECARECRRLRTPDGRARAVARPTTGLCNSFSYKPSSKSNNCILSPLSGRGLTVTSSNGQEVVGDSDWDLFEVVNADGDGDEVKDQVCVDPATSNGPSESKEETGGYPLRAWTNHSGLYYKHITILNDDSTVVSK